MLSYWFDVRERKILSSSQVQIVIRQHTENDGDICITPLMTAQEIDATVNAMKAELDLLAIKAKAIAQ